MQPLRECKLPSTYSIIQQLWEVMSNPSSSNQLNRQKVLFDTYFSVAGDSVSLKELKLLSLVLDLLSKNVEVHPQSEVYFQKILDKLRNPIKIEKSSDQLTYLHHLIEFFNTVGNILLSIKNKKLKSQLLDITLKILLTKQIGNSDMIPRKPCIQAVELSVLAECLADFIAVSDEENYPLTILTTLEICLMSKLCCWSLLMKEIIESLLVRLTIVHREKIADSVYQLLWTLLTCTDRSEDWQKVPIPSRMALRSLRYVLREQALTHAHPGNNATVLHNIAALTLRIIYLFPSGDFVLSGLTEDITISATLSECFIGREIYPYFKSKQDHLHFKKLMLACLSAIPVMPVRSMSVQMFERYRLAECLVTMLNIESHSRPLRDNSKRGSLISSSGKSSSIVAEKVWFTMDREQSIDLFNAVVPVVCTLYDSLHQKFIDAGLLTTLISFLNNRYLKEGNNLDDLAQIVIKTLFFICFSRNHPQDSQNALREAETISTLLQLCDIILKSEHSLTISLQSILWHNLHVLAALMRDQFKLQNDQAGISFGIVTLLYKRILKPYPSDSIIDNRLVIAVCDFTWEVLVRNDKNVLHFINSGTLFLHLDILERSPSSLQLIYLSMLVDICEYHQSVPYLVSWRDRKGENLLSLLCKVWREEEKVFKVPKNENGCILDIERALIGEAQFKHENEDKKNCLSICDIFGSCRLKIYAIVQLLHRHSEVTKLCEEHYKLGHDKLSWENQVTLLLIKAYFPLKMGEIWFGISRSQELLLPLDRYLVQNLANRYLDWSLSVQKAQHSVLNQRDEFLKNEEKRYYSNMHSVHLTSALESLREVIAVAKTADRQMLLRSHQKLREGIDASRVAQDIDLRVAFPKDINVLVYNPNADIVLQKEAEYS